MVTFLESSALALLLGYAVVIATVCAMLLRAIARGPRRPDRLADVLRRSGGRARQ